MVVIFFKQAYFYCFPYKKVRADARTSKGADAHTSKVWLAWACDVGTKAAQENEK